MKLVSIQWLNFGGGLLWSNSNRNSRTAGFLFSGYGESLKDVKGKVMSSGLVLSGRTRGILFEVRRPAGQWFLCLRQVDHSSRVSLGCHLFPSLLVHFVSHMPLPLAQ